MSLESTLDEVRARDLRDSTRAVAPLRRAHDAIEVDSSGLAIDDVVDRMAGLVALAANERRA